MSKPKNRKMKKISNCLLLSLLPLALEAQQMTYDQYIKAVAGQNASYLAEQYEIDIAQANLQAAKVFNDPELSVEYGNNQDWYMYMGQSVDVSLSLDLDLAGVRRARIRTARTEQQITEATVAAYLSTLRCEASQAWAEAWRLRQSCLLMQAAVADMRQVAQADSIRLSVGDIGSTDAMQSRLEAQTLEGDLIALQAEYRSALSNLSLLCGGTPVADLADDALPVTLQPLSEEQVIATAEHNRADLRAAELSHTLSANNLRLVKASRALEMNLSLGYSYNSEVRNEIAPAPKFNGLSVGVTIPLKFSSLNRGERRAAEHQVQQSQLYYEASLQQVRHEAVQAYAAHHAAQQVLSMYDDTMLREARTIVESRKVGYQRGESSLLEFLTAQQTYRDVMQAYIDATASRFSTYAQLQASMGM